MIRLIGLMGYAGAGKSEVARILRRDHGFITPHIKQPFAEMLRTLLRHVGYDEAMCDRFLDGDLKRSLIPEIGVTSTDAQQSLGTEWGRRCLRDSIWSDLWCQKIDATIAAGGRAALESCRFKNEAAAILERGGILIEVRRPGVGPLGQHESEAIPARPQALIENCGSLQDLCIAVGNVLTS